jgi:acetyl esterase/lipase
LLAEFAQRGFVAISPQYRFCPESPFPAQVHDVKAAVRWLRRHAGDYNVDPERIGAIGFSAGGHLALMLGLTGSDDGLEGEAEAGAPSSKVQVVVNFFGPTDLAAKDFPEVSQGLLRDFLGGTAEEKPELARLASPAAFASADDPPVLTFQGTKDELVPHTQATLLAESLTRAGAKGSRVDLLVGAGHGWQGAELQRTKAASFRFLEAALKPGSGGR